MKSEIELARELYKERVTAILANFQLLELVLKIYIGKSYELIAYLVEDRIHFDFSISDVENYPLERLLNLFGKMNRNEELKKRLNKLRTERNYVAHEGLLVTVGSTPNMDSLHQKARDFFFLQDELAECLNLLNQESKMLLQRFSQVNS